MNPKIRYAKVVVPDNNHETMSDGGHTDLFISPEMETDVVIQVKHRSERGWYRSIYPLKLKGWNYHCSWLKFVKKPVTVKK